MGCGGGVGVWGGGFGFVIGCIIVDCCFGVSMGKWKGGWGNRWGRYVV